MSGLKPCPFCGTETAVVNDDHAMPDLPDCGHYEIECGSCQAYTWGEELDKAILTWNSRAEEAPDAMFRVTGGFFGWLGLAIAAPVLTVCFIVAALFLIVVGLPLAGVVWCLVWIWFWNEDRKSNAKMRRSMQELLDRQRAKEAGARNG